MALALWHLHEWMVRRDIMIDEKGVQYITLILGLDHVLLVLLALQLCEELLSRGICKT